MHTHKENEKDYDLIGYIRFPKPKPTLFRKVLNKLLRSRENPENLPQAHLSEKANSPRKFSGKILKLVGMLLWIIVGLNIIITFLIYKILFQ
jgi:hypothetical protein